MTHKHTRMASGRLAPRHTDWRGSIPFRHGTLNERAQLSDSDFDYATSVEDEVVALRDVEPDFSGSARPTRSADLTIDTTPQLDRTRLPAPPHEPSEQDLHHAEPQEQALSSVLDIIGPDFTVLNDTTGASEVELSDDADLDSSIDPEPDDLPQELLTDPTIDVFADIGDLVLPDDAEGDALLLPQGEDEGEDEFEDLPAEFLDVTTSDARDYDPALDDFVALQEHEDPWPLEPESNLLRVTPEQRAQQIAQAFAQEYGWDREGVQLLTSLFLKNTWNNMSQSAMRRLLDAGVTVRELELADQVREVWLSRQEFSEYVYHDGTTTHRFRILSWPTALGMVRAYQAYPDIEEIEMYLSDAYRTWSGHEPWAGIDDLQHRFPAFFYFLCHVLTAQADNELPPPFNDF